MTDKNKSNGATPGKDLDREERKIDLERKKIALLKDKLALVGQFFRILPTPKEAPLLWLAIIGTLGGGSIKAGLHMFGIDNPALFNVNSVPRVEAPPAAAPSVEEIEARVLATVEARGSERRAAWRARRNRGSPCSSLSEHGTSNRRPPILQTFRILLTAGLRGCLGIWSRIFTR